MAYRRRSARRRGYRVRVRSRGRRRGRMVIGYRM